MKLPVHNQQGKEIGQVLLPKEIFDVKVNPDLIHQITVAQIANKRRVIAHTKDRSEVSGGGRKPWRQKGTGRARHGSIRSPIWRHGGITFGPRRDRNFRKKIPAKMKRKALFMILSEKLKNNLLILVEKLKIEKPKTKELLRILEKLLPEKSSCLIVLPDDEKEIALAARNIEKTKAINASGLNCLDLISFKYILMPKEVLKTIEKTFAG